MPNTPADWTITRRSESEKPFSVVYEESGSRLDVDFQRAPLRARYEWVASTDVFADWTTPHGTAIPHDHGETIRKRVELWAYRQGLRLGFEPRSMMQEYDRMAASLRRSRRSSRLLSFVLLLAMILATLVRGRIALSAVIVAILSLGLLAYSYRPIKGL
ncbi:MAG: hypothetical protein ACJ8AJ_11505 [Gemmatimonadaceae bacterium]